LNATFNKIFAHSFRYRPAITLFDASTDFDNIKTYDNGLSPYKKKKKRKKEKKEEKSTPFRCIVLDDTKYLTYHQRHF